MPWWLSRWFHDISSEAGGNGLPPSGLIKLSAQEKNGMEMKWGPLSTLKLGINAKIWMNGGMDRGRNCGRRGGRGWRTNMEMGWIVTSTDSSSLIPSRKCALWPSHITIRWIKKVLIYFFCVKANEIGGGGLTNVAAGLHFAPFYQE